MVNIKSKGCRFGLNTTQTNKFKSIKLLIWVKPTNEVITTKQLIRIYIINSQKPASLKIVEKVTTSKTGYWLTIESRRIKKFLNNLLSSSSDQNTEIGLLANPKIFKVVLREKSGIKVN